MNFSGAKKLVEEEEEVNYESDVSECPFGLSAPKEIEFDNSSFQDTVPIYDVNSSFVFSKNVEKIFIHEFQEDIGPCHDLPLGSSEETFLIVFLILQCMSILLLRRIDMLHICSNRKRRKIPNGEKLQHVK